MSGGPTRFVRRLIEQLVDPREREYVLGDLEEEYARRRAEGSGARLWLGRQLLRAIAHRLSSRGEATRGMRPIHAIGSLLRDVVQAARSLRRAPALAATAIVTLALGIGANTAIFTLLDHALLRPLPFPEPERLVRLYNVHESGGPDRWNLSYPDFDDLRESLRTIDRLAGWREETPALLTGEDARASRVRVAAVTAGLPEILGMEPLIGRGIGPEDDSADLTSGVAVLSWGIWQERFGGEHDVLGRDVRLDGRPYTIVGVYPELPGSREGGGMVPAWDVDLWVAYLSSMAQEGSDVRGLTNVAVVGRMAPDTTIDEVDAEARSLAGALAERFPDGREDVTMRPVPVTEVVRARSRQPLWLLYGAVSLVLLIAGANVAHLLVGRNLARRRELAVRMAIGASRWQVLRRILAESTVLAAGGALVGVGIGWAVLRVFRAGAALPLPGLPEASLDPRVLGVTAAVALLVGLLFGLLPAWQATRRDPNLALRNDSRTATGGDGFRRVLTVAETALALVLLVAAALTLQSLTRVLDSDPGFVPDDIMTARIQLPMEFVSADWPQAVELFDTLLERIEALPEVEAAAAGLWLPVDEGWNNSFALPEGMELPAGQSVASARFLPITPGYFEITGTRLVSGRTFTDADASGAPGVAIVNESFARYYFADREVMGEVIGCSNWWRAIEGGCEIVGVVEDVLFNGRTEPSSPALYLPHAQQPVREMSLMVKSRPGAGDVAAAMRAELEALDPALPLDEVATLESRLAEVDGPRRAIVRLLAGFAVLALVLAGIGVYGVMAFLVTRRTREIGIRMALGAGTGRVRGAILREGGLLLLLGLAIGGVAGALLSGYLESMLYEVGRYDPLAFAGASAFLLIVGLAACWLPALRATRIDPARSLRTD